MKQGMQDLKPGLSWYLCDVYLTSIPICPVFL